MKKFINCVFLSLVLSVVMADVNSPSTELLPQAPNCGNPHEPRILNGPIADLSTYPWTVLIGYSKPNQPIGFKCSGILISKRYVVTPAHCVSGSNVRKTWNLTSVRIGEFDLLTDPDCEANGDCNLPVIDVPISEKIVHELFDQKLKNFANDIALLRLESDVVFSDAVQPICLSRASNLPSNNYENVRYVATGWYRRSNEYSTKLRGYVTEFNTTECKSKYNTMGVTIQDTQLCAISREGFDPCAAMSGSPIMILDRSDNTRPHYNLVGFSSFGKSFCGGDQAWPDVYTRIDSYVDWIQSKVYA